MAGLCGGQESGRSAGRQVQGALDRPRPDIWPAYRRSDQPGGLPGILRRSQEAWLCRQHDQDRPGVIARLSAAQVRRRRTEHLDTACFCPARSMAYQGTGAVHRGPSRDTAHKAIRHAWAGNRGQSGGNLGPNMEPRGLRAQDHRFSPRWARPDEQAARGRTYEPDCPRGARNGLQGQIDRSRDRVRREACGIGQKGNPAVSGAGGHSVLAAHPAPHLRGLDGTGRCANAENQPVSRPHFAANDRAGLCAVLTLIYARCGRSCDVLVYAGTQWFGRYTRRNGGNAWWALTGSNRRPSRCKLRVSTPNCAFSANHPAGLRNMSRFRFACVPRSGTQVHIGRQRDWYSRAALTTNAKGPRNG